jgi:plastocyanin
MKESFMSRNPDTSKVSRRRFLAAAGSVAAASSFATGKDTESVPALPPPTAPTAYDVTIDVTRSPISYSYPSLTVPQPAYRLKVKTGDTVTWTAKSPGPKHCVSIVFKKDTPLIDRNGRPIYTLLWSERIETPKGPQVTVDPDAAGIYEYSVAVLDEGTQVSYTDDPKIIVGSGGLDGEAQLTLAKEALKDAAQLEPARRGEIENIEKQVEHVLSELKD